MRALQKSSALIYTPFRDSLIEFAEARGKSND